ncbi:MAG: 2OG-Fe(II) oxygenase [Nevskiaceae bacterium]|nr:MAG: 2OG-Fe(II) oxygenase [Nevskiaceae bacterium]TBR73559.1 MAG: 2OG-Fe(II) oxygenase [Nevskiaceae bacterium]
MNAVMQDMPAASADADLRTQVRERLAGFDVDALRKTFRSQHEFIYLPQLLTADVTAQLVAAMQATRGTLNRNFIPGHKKGGSVSRHAIDRLAPWIVQLYQTPEFITWLEALCGQKLQRCPADDPHAYALYFYTEAGDHIGWHYDTSYYKGARYTILFGVVDESSCKLGYRLHTRNPGHAVEEAELSLRPGDFVFFNGDYLQHRITPSKEGEVRVSLTLEYVTDPRMASGWRLFSNLKDAIGYFGFRQTFHRQN